MIPNHAFVAGRVTTRATLSTGLNTVPKIDRNDRVAELPCKSSVTKMIEVNTSSAMIRLDFIDRTATREPCADLLEGGLSSQTFHGFDVVKSHAATKHHREQWLGS